MAATPRSTPSPPPITRPRSAPPPWDGRWVSAASARSSAPPPAAYWSRRNSIPSVILATTIPAVIAAVAILSLRQRRAAEIAGVAASAAGEGLKSLIRTKNRSLVLAGAALLGATPLAANSAGAETEIKVGVISTMSGPDAEHGIEIIKGIDLYVKEHGKELPAGVKLTLIYRDDTGTNPDVAKRLAQELVTRDHVNFLAGEVWSPNAAAIAPVATEAKVPFVIMNAAAAPITRLSPYIVRDSFTLWQPASPIGQWAAKQGWKKGYSAVSDYTPGYDAEGGFSTAFTAGGGAMLDKVRMAPRPRISRPSSSASRTQARRRLHLRARGQAGDRGDESLERSRPQTGRRKARDQPGRRVRRRAAEHGSGASGHRQLRDLFHRRRPPANQVFLNAWREAYGDGVIANYMAVDGWDGMHMIFDVIKETNGEFDGDQAMKILAHWKTADSPRGPVAIDPATRDAIENVYIRRVES